MFSEGVDAAPCRNNCAIEEFLGTAGTSHPDLSNKKKNSQDDTIRNKGTSHDKVCRALPNMFSLTEPECCNSAKHHLCPGQDRHRLTNNGVAWSDELSDFSIHTLFPVALQVETKNNLADEKEL